jgi:hypothetical protein
MISRNARRKVRLLDTRFVRRNDDMRGLELVQLERVLIPVSFLQFVS